MLLHALLLAFGATLSPAAATPLLPDVALGAPSPTVCAVCTVAVSVLERLAVVHNETIDHEVENFCKLFPQGAVRTACDTVIMTYGPTIIKLLVEKENADVVCTAIKLCDGTCHLFSPPSGGVAKAATRAVGNIGGINGLQLRLIHGLASSSAAPPSPPLPPGLPAICKLPGLRELCEAIYGFANNHLPLTDEDHDGFSTLQEFRGTDWRGKDCNSKNANVHPGAMPIDDDRYNDSNCNGIFGVNPATRIPYEVELCGNTSAMGTVVLGDSASAHFHVPPAFLDATQIDGNTYKNIGEILENEFDWPMLSSTTAFYNTTAPFSHDILGPVNSSYAIMRARNRCNHRDYQNIAVNGARTGAMNSTIQETLSRNQMTDKPVVLMYALIGNDVCNGHEDTVAHMTTPLQFRENVMATISFLESRLPAGSHVLMMGLADGKILYENLYNRIHPLGVPYKNVYDFLNCLSISPCRGWMNSNETLRELTQQRADELSTVLKNITENTATKKFDLHYVQNPIDEAIQRWTAMGRETWELIEPVDGFHPNQIANALVADVVWDHLMAEAPNMVPINPHNEEIARLFGEQGGY